VVNLKLSKNVDLEKICSVVY